MMGEMEVGPDKGWSWIIAFAACFSSLVLAGIFRTGGVLFVVFIDAFGVTREEASWPMVICISVLNFTGPIAGILGQKCGVRPVVILGAVVGAIGVSSCFLANSLNVITILFGGVFGFGYGLVNTMMPVIVNAYFLNLRGLANGIANSGSCFGSMILPMLFEYLIFHYGLSGCFLLTGGVVLNVAVVGALLRPPAWLSERAVNVSTCTTSFTSGAEKKFAKSSSRTAYRRKSSNPSESSTDRKALSSKIRFINREAECGSSETEQKFDSHHILHTELVEALKIRTNAQVNVSNTFSGYKDPSSDSLFSTSSSLCVDKKTGLNDPSDKLFSAQKELQDSLNDFQSAVHSILETSQSEEVLNTIDETEDVKTSVLTDACPARHSFSISSNRRPKRKLNKNAILSNKPLKKCNLKFENSSGDLFPVPTLLNKTSFTNQIETKRVSVTVMDDIEEEDKQELDSFSIVKSNKQSVLQSFQCVLSCPMFYLTALTNVSFYFLFHMYVVIIVDYSMDCGVLERDTKHILFAFSAADLFGRLCFGWITDRKYLTRSRFVMLCMAAIGVVFLIFPFASAYWTLIIASCAYGVLLGCTMIIFPILLVDYLGTELHAVSYGCLCFLHGFSSLTRPIIIGYFRDNIGSYSNIFYILGVISVVAASTWLLETCFNRKNSLKHNISDSVKQRSQEEEV